MVKTISAVRLRVGAVLVACALLLSGCFVTPGKFVSELELTGADSFTFRYEGEVFFLGLSKLAQMGVAAETFTPSCTNEETFEPRECSAAEAEAQRSEWQAGAEARAAEAKERARQMAAIMGGIDPSDPAAAEELVKLLQRQKGWDRVVHKGDGLFEVTYRVSGTLGHDFMFPAIEGFPATNPFVQIVLRKGGQVRVNAPGFAAQDPQSPTGSGGGMMGLGSLAGIAALSAPEGSPDNAAMAAVPVIDGTFILRTAPGMRILANNTDEGPTTAATGQVLAWRITPRTAQSPTALIATAP